MSRSILTILDARRHNTRGGSSSYFDFVEQKAQEELAVAAENAMELAESGRDAFVVQVMDEETATELKRRYFS